MSHGIGCNDEIEQLFSLQRAGLLSAADFARMTAEILKTDSERLREAPPDAPHDSSPPGERAPPQARPWVRVHCIGLGGWSTRGA